MRQAIIMLVQAAAVVLIVLGFMADEGGPSKNVGAAILGAVIFVWIGTMVLTRVAGWVGRKWAAARGKPVLPPVYYNHADTRFPLCQRPRHLDEPRQSLPENLRR